MRFIRLTLMVLLALALFGAGAFWLLQQQGWLDGAPETARSWTLGSGEEQAAFTIHPRPQPLPELPFSGPDGGPMSLDHFQGQVVLLNLWATWCPPCREEMPALDRLQARLGGDEFRVVTVALEKKTPAEIRAFFEEVGVSHLVPYVEPSGNLVFQVGTPGLPTTLLIDREGREVGRLLGPAPWDGPEAERLIRTQLEQGTLAAR